LDPVRETLSVLRWSPDGFIEILSAMSGERVRAEPFDVIEISVARALSQPRQRTDLPMENDLPSVSTPWWLRATSRYRATHAGGSNFTYELCVRRAGDEELTDVNISSLRV
jgi:hypothetical protein